MAKKKLLEEYKRKRDFKITKEPSGKVPKKKATKLKFVVQEHHARRLHYDFRLELEGVLKSWAVPKGPSLDPADKRLAVQTEDHPLEYGKFHGTIPKGEYGAGEVFIWDNGTWESESPDPIEALEKGQLKFKLKGKKLKGSFILVRIRSKGDNSDKNWLLIKHSDKQAEKVSPKKKVQRENRDPWPNFIVPQLPRLVTSVPDEASDWVHEVKFDGYRIQSHINNGLAKFYTRNALDWSNKFPHLLNAIENISVKNAIFDGEIVALDKYGKGNFQKLQNSLKTKDDSDLRYYIFDIMYLNGKDLQSLPLLERKRILQDILKDASPVIIYSQHILDGGKDFYQASCEHKLEGIVSKLGGSPYQSGRNDLWTKTKCSSRQEFVIGGWSDPKGGRTGIGALLLGVYERRQLRYVGRVGTGFNTKTLREIKKQLSILETKDSPFDINTPKNKDIHWVNPQKICEVSFGNWTDEGILRHAAFQGMREDKSSKDIQMETAKKITSPDKVIFKKEGKTKQDVADFYKTVAKDMLPYMANRPLSLVRCPNGSEGSCFFQKHINGSVPEAFHTFPIKENKEEGIYLSIDSVQGLQELVQLNAFEIHAWNCHKDNYMKPDQIVMDFDPGPGVRWTQVIEGAFEFKKMLEDINLKSFVKLTGGKGLHVHIPIKPIYDWDQIKAFTQSLALEMVHRNPKLYVASMSKKLRMGKIFLDYLRNGYGATAVVPYSLRANPLSAIAMPLDWKELKRVKNPQEFTMDKALIKIKKRKCDPWKEMHILKQRIVILDEWSSLVA